MLPKDFVDGFQWYLDNLPVRMESTPRIVITVLVDDVEVSGIVDTGATQFVLGWEAGRHLVTSGAEVEPQTRALGGGVHQGFVFPVIVTFPADEGVEATLEALAWTAESFGGPNLIGYGGLLEKVRFAVDPAENRFYFGA